jgi:hypothetical protein
MLAERPAEVCEHPIVPTAEMVLIRVFVSAFLATADEKPKRRARAFLDAATRMLADEESVSVLLPHMPAAERLAVNRARRQAITLYRALLPTFVAKLPPE